MGTLWFGTVEMMKSLLFVLSLTQSLSVTSMAENCDLPVLATPF
jgi:hypothetical protein